VICEFTFDDGAYVLGALAPAERADFERHLPGCGNCRESVAGLAVLPGLLSRLDFASSMPSVSAPPNLLGRTLATMAIRRRAERRRRTLIAVAASVTALVLASGVGAGVHFLDGVNSPSTTLTAMLPVDDHSPVTAEVGLVATSSGTRVEMTCRYAEGYEGTWVLRLVVFPRWGGNGESIGSWTAVAGQELFLAAVTHYAPNEIARVELQRSDTTTMLTWINAS
jgi:anti-sigma factor RsiW